MNPKLRYALVVMFSSVLAVYLAWQIAEGDYALPAMAAVSIVAAVLVRLTRLPVDVIALGLLVFGYLVGNRGFAQLMPISGVPLFPAECVLLLAFAWRIVVCAFERNLPYERDMLNLAVLAWLVIGTIRVAFDVPRFGLLAVRDYAMVYYAVFFFLAQHMARDARIRRYLLSCLFIGGIVLTPLYVLSEIFPAFFLQQLTVHGVPLIYYKGDIVRTFFAVAAVLIFHWARGPQRAWAWPLSAVIVVFVATAENRASFLGLAVTCLLLLLARRWRFPALLGSAAGLGLIVVVALATVFGNVWAERKLASFSDRFTSITDFSGDGRYRSDDSYYKGDNNRFRLVWWRNVIEDTWDSNPLFGLGFGADLAHGFVQEYYPDAGEEFNVRSPHSIVVTTFGRMGAVGLVAWLAFCGVLLQRTWHSLRHQEEPVTWSLWCGAWTVLVSASLGVVLEGPMGAVIFWTLLGLANSRSLAPEVVATPPAGPAPSMSGPALP